MPGEGLSQQKSSVYTHCVGESRKNWENDIFSPFLYCLCFIWTHASSGLKVSRNFMFLRPKKQFSLGKEDSWFSLRQGSLAPSSRSPLLFQTPEEAEQRDLPVERWLGKYTLYLFQSVSPAPILSPVSGTTPPYHDVH